MLINSSWKGTGPSYGQNLSSSDCLKIFLLVSTLPMMIQVSQKSVHLAQKCHFYQKITNRQT